MSQESWRQRPQPESQGRTNAFLRFSGMAIQMAVTIGLGVWGGIQLDKKFPNDAHAWTLSLSLVSVGVAMYMVIKDLLKKK
jgi:ATP synthase protein I